LLGGPSAGYWDITAANCAQAPTQQWTGDNFVLRTRWNTGPSDSALTVTDYLDTSVGRAFQRSGRTDLVRVLSGHGRAVVRFAPRLDFGRAPTRLEIVPNGLRILGAPEPTVLHAPGVAWQIAEEGPHQTASAEIALSGHEHVLELRCGTASTRPASLPEPERRRQSERFWSTWAESLTVPALHAGVVRRSALSLRALCHGPTGAIAAAATTSLPEQLGGVRNWDYRYCWPRDAALAARALIRLGNTGVALRLLDWLAGVVSGLPSPDRLRPIYDLAGHDLGSEAQIAELTGYGQSRPVRIGNAAATQVQIDVFGPVVDLAASVAERGAPITPEVWRLVESMVRAVSHRWREPDHGIWEIRATPRHHLHSKVMCWHAVDRAIAVAALALGTDKPDWAALRDEIAADARANGWNERLGFYTGWYGGDALDAGALLLATSGFLDPADPRLHATIDAITRSLARGPLVMRYQGDDGLPGMEGAMLICSFWLVEALSIIGRHSQAEGIFDQLCEFVPASGLLSEQIDPAGPTALGNFPQAYSHLGLINAAVRLARHRDHGAADQGAHR
jgi:trehalose 6-phosphate phosphatase